MTRQQQGAQRRGEQEWRDSTLNRPRVPIGKPVPIRRANWLGRLVDRVARLLDARQP